MAKGFNSVLALEHVKEFDASEFELLLCGFPTIDMDDWQQNVEYRSGFNANHAAIGFFWAVVAEMGEESRAKLLRFVTGTSALPAVSLLHCCRRSRLGANLFVCLVDVV